MRKAAFLLILLCGPPLAGGPAGAQESAAFLKLPVSPRAGGMGDASAALADDVFGLYYNPAGAAFVRRPSASFAYQQYLHGISGNSFGFVYPFKSWAVALAPTVYSMKAEPVYNWLGEATGEKVGYDARIVPLALAWRAGKLAAGVAGKSYGEDLGGQTSSTFACDAGAIYRPGKLSLGVSAHNMGGRIFGYKAPVVRRAGAAYAGRRFSAAAELKKEGEDQAALGFGGTFFLDEALGFCGGWRLKDEFGGITFGLNLKFGSLKVDYAYLSYGDLGTTNKAGFSLVFGDRPAGVPKPKKAEAPLPAPQVRLSTGASLAVAGFSGSHVTGENAAAVAAYVRTRLAETGLFSVLKKEDMDNLLAAQGYREVLCAERECAAAMGKLLHVDTMLVGSISRLAGTYFITVTVVDARSGEITGSLDGDASSEEELTAACDRIVEKLSRQ